MAQQQTENLNDINQDLDGTKNLLNGTDLKSSFPQSRNNMSEQKVKSPSGAIGGSNGNPMGGNPPMIPGGDMMHGYSNDPSSHHPSERQQDDPYGQQQPPPPPPSSQYARYHDPNDPYGHYHRIGPGGAGGKPMIPPNRPPQRYMPGNPGPVVGSPVPTSQQQQQQQGQQQGPTPTLNSLLQSHPPPTHRYPNNYDPQQQQQQQPPPQSYPGPGPQQGWAPPPRPYSPQMGQPYRNPPPVRLFKFSYTYLISIFVFSIKLCRRSFDAVCFYGIHLKFQTT